MYLLTLLRRHRQFLFLSSFSGIYFSGTLKNESIKSSEKSSKMVPTFGKNASTKNNKVPKRSKKFVAPLKASQKVTEPNYEEISNSQSSQSDQCLTQNSQSQDEAMETNQPSKTQEKTSQGLFITQKGFSQMNLHLDHNLNSVRQSLCRLQNEREHIVQEPSTLAKANISNMEQESQYFQSYNPFEQALDYLEPFTPMESLMPLVETDNDGHWLPNQPINENYQLKLKDSKKKSVSLGGILLGTLNILNDDIDSVIQTQESDKSSVKALSRNQSKCSVVSLKRYRDLDHNSNDNLPIPISKDFNILLKSAPIGNNIKVAMDITLGDMGFNRFYSDYIKSVGYHEEVDPEANKTYELMLKMYAKENKKLIDVRKKRKIK